MALFCAIIDQPHMKLKHLFVIIALLLSAGAFAQAGRTIKGMVADTTKATVPGATVILYMGTDSLVTTTGMDGIYTFPSVKVKQFSLQVTSIGYEGVRRRITLDSANTAVFLKPVILKTSSTMLN